MTDKTTDGQLGEHAADELDAFRFRWDDLPALSEALLGTGGVIRERLGDFEVDELPLYAPDGKGSHAFAHVEKRGLTTRDLVVALKNAGVAENTIGVAGLKDKYAVTRQWLSVPNRHAEAFAALDELDGVRVLDTTRHRNKLGIGHLLGNRFRVTIRGAADGAVERAEAILGWLEPHGVPNYFGPQRFGRFGNNAIDGLRVLRGEKVSGDRRLQRFFLSALQSHLFNHLLAERVRAGLYDEVVTGDRAKKHDTGGLFVVEDGAAETPRAKRLEISAAFPLYGKKVKVCGGVAGEFEQQILERFGLRWIDFRQRRGAWRISRIALRNASVEAGDEDDSVVLSFDLPKGSFATNLLREVMKVEVDAPIDRSGGEDDGDEGGSSPDLDEED
ncbi:MAG: tRNA pseudouridine(13) synthase TruD [Trueperaceae bacterium]|nr:tRNA pseudouridine(13) synthase TruD [Trueperaceae bacterium]